MTEALNIKKTGGTFLLESTLSTTIFTREQFSEEQKEIETMVKDFCKDRIAPQFQEIEDKQEGLSVQLLREMGELGLLSIDIPESLGGMELDKTTAVIITEVMHNCRSASFMTTFSVQTGIGLLPILWFGNDEQKKKYLPKLAKAEWVGAYALTEPSAGSDATNSKTTAVLSEDGKHYILNGEKQFISNGSWADVFTLFAQVDGHKFTAFIVDKDSPGFEIGPEEHKLGVQGSSTTSLKLTDAKVPIENVLYEIGKGATIAFNALNIGRLKLGAGGMGGCKGVIEGTVNYALERRQFGQSIAKFDIIKSKVADMAVKTYALDSIVYRTIGMIDDAVKELDKTADDFYLKMGEAMEKFAIESSMVKVSGSETLGFCADTGIQILGGYGFIEEYPMARIYRDTRIDRIWEGTNEINRQIITGYTMKKALLDEIPLKLKMKQFDDFLSSDFAFPENTLLAKEEEIIDTGKHLALYVLNEGLSEFGQDLRHEQQLGESLADNFIDLYLAESTLIRVRQALQSNGQHTVISSIAQVFAAEASLRLMNRSLTGLNAIYHGQLPNNVIDKLRKCQVRMLPHTDIPALKRQIAEYVYLKKIYPF
tara:strand:- start:8195 stop:9982 length:1788 start_codon:yes stop_codon:yes gene_type:complete